MSRKRRPVHTGPLNDATTPPDALKRLWGSVLWQACCDLVSSSEKPSDQLEAWRVRGWIGSPDFVEVCHAATEIAPSAMAHWMSWATANKEEARKQLRHIQRRLMGGLVPDADG